MTFVAPYRTVAPEPPGTGGLLAYGIISIVIGGMAGLMSLMLPAMMLLVRAIPATPGGRPPVVPLSSAVSGVVIYLLIAASFVTVGIGSIRHRRWVRPIILCIAWPSMILGVVSIAFVVPMMIQQQSAMPASAPMPPAVKVIMWVVMGGIMAVFYIGLPLAYILFYHRASLKESLDLLDPKPRWTDRAPMPVLGLSIWMCFFALGSLALLRYACLPAFGHYITGPAAMAIGAGLSIVIVLAAIACFRQQIAGWWVAIVLQLLWTSSAAYTFGRDGIIEFYRQAKLPAEQIKLLEKQSFFTGPMSLVMVGTFGVLTLGYLIYVRRYFVKPVVTGLAT